MTVWYVLAGLGIGFLYLLTWGLCKAAASDAEDGWP